jgi:hypothetical protein
MKRPEQTPALFFTQAAERSSAVAKHIFLGERVFDSHILWRTPALPKRRTGGKRARAGDQVGGRKARGVTACWRDPCRPLCRRVLVGWLGNGLAGRGSEGGGCEVNVIRGGSAFPAERESRVELFPRSGKAVGGNASWRGLDALNLRGRNSKGPRQGSRTEFSTSDSFPV